MNLEFWKHRKILLTGHTGFKGSWLTLWLQHLGAELVGYSLPPPTEPSVYELAGINQGIHSIHGDVRDLSHLKTAITDHQPEILIHMAAQSLVRRSYQDPVGTYETNVMGTVNVLESARQSGIRVVIIVTSDKCYHNREWVWGYRENDPLGGEDPYSSSKGCAELVTHAFTKSFFNPASADRTAVASVRAGNVIGGGDWAEDRLVPDIMRAALERRPVVIRNPNSIRPWQHVLDPLSGYLLLAEKLFNENSDLTGSWNFGPREDDTKTVQWIKQRLSELWGEEIRSNLDANENPHEAHSLKLDCSKAHRLLNWRPRWDLERTLQAVVEWYKAYHTGEDVRDLMIRQIENFSEDV